MVDTLKDAAFGIVLFLMIVVIVVVYALVVVWPLTKAPDPTPAVVDYDPLVAEKIIFPDGITDWKVVALTSTTKYWCQFEEDPSDVWTRCYPEPYRRPQ